MNRPPGFRSARCGPLASRLKSRLNWLVCSIVRIQIRHQVINGSELLQLATPGSGACPVTSTPHPRQRLEASAVYGFEVCTTGRPTGRAGRYGCCVCCAGSRGMPQSFTKLIYIGFVCIQFFLGFPSIHSISAFMAAINSFSVFVCFFEFVSTSLSSDSRCDFLDFKYSTVTEFCTAASFMSLNL